MAKKEDSLLDHEYDGIREYDNPTPGWWKWMWFGSFVFSVFYFAHYSLGDGVSPEDAYLAEMVIVDKERAEEAEAASRNVSEEALAALLTDSKAIEVGTNTYNTNCVACHGVKGEGGIGPNLTDAYWIHGNGSLLGIHTVVYDGVIEKGMVPWGKTLAPDVLSAVVAYVGTMRGKNETGKAPQGDKHAPVP